MSTIRPLSEVKAKLSEILDDIETTHGRVTITRNGRPIAVILSSDELEAIEETLDILSDPEAVRQIDAGVAALRAGEFATRSDLEAIRQEIRTRAV